MTRLLAARGGLRNLRQPPCLRQALARPADCGFPRGHAACGRAGDRAGVRTNRALRIVALALAAALALGPPPSAEAAAGEPDVELATLHAHAQAEVGALHLAALDAEADALRRSRGRLADGRWKLSMLFDGIDDAIAHAVVDEADRHALDDAASDYARTHPASANAGLFLARVYLAEGWMARGRGDWSDVPADGRRRFQEALARARATLDAGRAVLSANPLWYADRIEIASLGGEPLAKIDALLREALAREPRFHAAAYAALAARAPRRGGSTQAMVAFIDDVGRAGAGARAEGLHARLVAVAGEEVPGIEHDPALDWPAMTQAFEAILGSYPAPRNVRRFLLMACDHPDRAAARALLRHLPPAQSGAAAPASQALGGDLERCIAWARESPASGAQGGRDGAR